MANESFQKNSLGWQFQLLQKRLGEWWEFQTQKFSFGEDADFAWLNNPIIVFLFQAIFWTIVIGFVLWIFWQLGKILSPYLYAWTPPWRKLEDNGVSSRVEASVEEWVQRSQLYQAQENYQEACLCLYQAMLQQLHNQDIAPKDGSRTDGEYLKITGNLTTKISYQILFDMHQQICFSSEQASSLLFRRCQQAWQEIVIS